MVMDVFSASEFSPLACGQPTYISFQRLTQPCTPQDGSHQVAAAVAVFSYIMGFEVLVLGHLPPLLTASWSPALSWSLCGTWESGDASPDKHSGAPFLRVSAKLTSAPIPGPLLGFGKL